MCIVDIQCKNERNEFMRHSWCAKRHSKDVFKERVLQQMSFEWPLRLNPILSSTFFDNFDLELPKNLRFFLSVYFLYEFNWIKISQFSFGICSNYRKKITNCFRLQFNNLKFLNGKLSGYGFNVNLHGLITVKKTKGITFFPIYFR